MKTGPHYLNTDLELRSKHDISRLLAAIKDDTIILHQSRKGTLRFAVLETLRQDANPEKTAACWCRIIESLPISAQKIWNYCENRTLNIGVQAGSSKTFDFHLRQETVNRIARTHASIAITIYPMVRPKKRECRRARRSELNSAYRMGFDAWGAGQTFRSYLKTCSSSKKYARGRWFVLCSEGAPVSSALVHDFPAWDELTIRGIGSIATAPGRRRQGFAGRLVEELTKILAEKEGASIIFLYSDIGSDFYEKRGFRLLEKRHQNHPGSLLMAWRDPKCSTKIFSTHKEKIPRYF